MSSWWGRNIVPRIIRSGCRHPELMAARSHVLPLASGDVFELGCGDGINLPLLDGSRVHSFSSIDPSEELLESAREAASAQPYPCDLRAGVGEDIPFASGSFDTVLTTLLGNCHMSREVAGSFDKAGFQTERLGGEFAGDLPRYAGWIEWGRAKT